MKPWVRDAHALLRNDLPPQIKQVQIKNPCRIPDGANPPENSLDLVKGSKRLGCRSIRTGQDYGIVEPRLVGNGHRRCLIPGRDSHDPYTVIRKTGDRSFTPCARRIKSVRCQVGTNPNQNPLPAHLLYIPVLYDPRWPPPRQFRLAIRKIRLAISKVLHTKFTNRKFRVASYPSNLLRVFSRRQEFARKSHT